MIYSFDFLRARSTKDTSLRPTWLIAGYTNHAPRAICGSRPWRPSPRIRTLETCRFFMACCLVTLVTLAALEVRAAAAAEAAGHASLPPHSWGQAFLTQLTWQKSYPKRAVVAGVRTLQSFWPLSV